MTDIKVNINRCKGCGLCVPQCPKQLIKMSKEMNEQGSYSPIINKKKCVGCGLCYQMCPDLAIEIKKSEAEGEKK